MKRTGWVIFSAAAIVTIAMGVRQAFGLFLPDMSTDLGIGRSSFGLSLALQNLLFGVPPFDVLTFVASALAIVTVGMVAATVPALRAARIDPVTALRD